MSVKWTPALLDQVRAHAARGQTMKRTADLLCVPLGSLMSYASVHRISFQGSRTPRRWTEALLDQVRGYAEAGHTQRRTAELLNVSPGSLGVYASAHGIRFHGRPTGGRKSTAPQKLGAREARAREAARLALAREIAGAVSERPTAPGYKPPGPLVW